MIYLIELALNHEFIFNEYIPHNIKVLTYLKLLFRKGWINE